MKKYIFLFNSKFETFVSGRNSGSVINIEIFNELHQLVKERINLKDKKSLYQIDFNILKASLQKIEVELKNLLDQRNISQLSCEQTDWKTRFTEEQMFQVKKIFETEYKLFNGGLDLKIFWFACLHELIENSIKNRRNIYVFFNDKVCEVKRLQRIILRFENNKLNQNQ